MASEASLKTLTFWEDTILINDQLHQKLWRAATWKWMLAFLLRYRDNKKWRNTQRNMAGEASRTILAFLTRPMLVIKWQKRYIDIKIYRSMMLSLIPVFSHIFLGKSPTSWFFFYQFSHSLIGENPPLLVWFFYVWYITA